MKKLVLIGIVCLIIGFVLADYMALWFAKQHGVTKYGGLFSNQPKAGVIQ